MDKEYRSRPDGSAGRAENDKEAPVAPDVSEGFTIGQLAREAGVTLRTLRFYQSKGLLAPQRSGSARIFTPQDRAALALILHGKRLGFTLSEIRDMLVERARGSTQTLPINRKKCVEQIAMLERQRGEVDQALAELRQIYNEMFPDAVPANGPTKGKPGIT